MQPSPSSSFTFRFRAALKIDADECETTKKRIRDLVDKHFDDRFSLTKQGEARWGAFIAELLAEYPILEREDCKQLLFEYLSKLLGARAYNHRRRAERSVVDDIEVRSQKRLRKRHLRGVEPLHSYTAKVSDRDVPSSSPTPFSSPPAYDSIGAMSDGIVAVEQFLSNANVPHLLRSFCKAGVDNRAKLETMASWHPSDLIDFLFELRREGWFTRYEGKILELEFRKM